MYCPHDERRRLSSGSEWGCYIFHSQRALLLPKQRVIFVTARTRHEIYGRWGNARFPKHAVVPECHRHLYDGTPKQKLYVAPGDSRHLWRIAEWVKSLQHRFLSTHEAELLDFQLLVICDCVKIRSLSCLVSQNRTKVLGFITENKVTTTFRAESAHWLVEPIPAVSGKLHPRQVASLSQG